MPKIYLDADSYLHWQLWETQKLERLLRRYAEWAVIGEHFDNRSLRAVRCKARAAFPELASKPGLARRARRVNFQPAEDCLIRQQYGRLSAGQLAVSLGRSRNSIIGRANKLRKLDRPGAPV